MRRGSSFMWANGVTGIRDMGSDLDLILEMRAATAARRVLGPRIFTAGPILDDAPGDWPLRMRVKTAQDGTAVKIRGDRKSTRLNSSHVAISYAVFCLKKKKTQDR